MKWNVTSVLITAHLEVAKFFRRFGCWCFCRGCCWWRHWWCCRISGICQERTVTRQGEVFVIPLSSFVHTVEGKHPAPVDMANIPLLTGFFYIPGGAGFLPSTVGSMSWQFCYLFGMVKTLTQTQRMFGDLQ